MIMETKQKIIDILEGMCFDDLNAVYERYCDACSPCEFECTSIEDMAEYIAGNEDDLGFEVFALALN